MKAGEKESCLIMRVKIGSRKGNEHGEKVNYTTERGDPYYADGLANCLFFDGHVAPRDTNRIGEHFINE